ncbi:class I SAM-dependent methyltransferase [bacterium]|nr:class I SAM-dependent methyltransferase [candidate division CSSED10-310 bacterium]
MAYDTREYTRITRQWLNQRFDLFDSDGIYIPNQPAYGFSALAFRLEEYARMYAVLRVLNRMRFTSVLDVGCADAYGPALIRYLFSTPVWGIDLSDRALLRGRDMFGIAGAASNAESLPFPDRSVDVVICTEVLEHVPSPQRVISELIRVSRKFVVVTTPRAPSELAKTEHFDTLDPNEPHAHIHYFTDSDMRVLTGPEAWISGARSRCIHHLLARLAWGDERTERQRLDYLAFSLESASLNNHSRRRMQMMLIDQYAKGPGWRRYVLTPPAAACLLRIDAALAAWLPFLAHDHIAVISVSADTVLSRGVLSSGRILKALLGGFSVPPLKRRSQ